MIRPLKGYKIEQNHHNGYFKASSFISQVNIKQRANNKSEKNLTAYFGNDNVKEFITELALEEDIAEGDLVDTRKGRYGGTWVHPLIFLDLALWVDPKFKVKVYKWIYDNLLENRDNSGDSFKEFNIQLDKHFTMRPPLYAKVANIIAEACDLPKTRGRWNKATEEQLKLRDKIQTNIALLAEFCPDIQTTLSNSIKKAKEKYD